MTSPFSLLARSRSTPSEFAEFYDQLAPTVLAYFMRQTRDGQVAYDLMAKTFAEAFAARNSSRGSNDAQAAGWLWTIARHELSKYRRTRLVELEALSRLGLERPVPTDSELRELEQLLALEAIVRDHMPTAMSRLSADQQQVIRLRFYEDLSTDEIAQRLAVSDEVVRSRLSRALKTLREHVPQQAALEILADT